MSSFTNHPLWKWTFPAPLRGPGYIARPRVRTISTSARLLQRRLTSKSPPQGVTIPNANGFMAKEMQNYSAFCS